MTQCDDVVEVISAPSSDELFDFLHRQEISSDCYGELRNSAAGMETTALINSACLTRLRRDACDLSVIGIASQIARRRQFDHDPRLGLAIRP